MAGFYQWIQPEAVALYAALIMLLFDIFASSKLTKAAYILLSLLLLLAAVFVPYAYPFGFKALRIDVFTVSARLFLSAVFFLAALYLSAFAFDKEKPGLYASLTFFSLFGAMLLPEVQDLILLLIAFEISALPAYAVSGFFGSKKEAEASVKYYVSGAFASGLFILGAALLSGVLGSTSFEAIGSRLSQLGGFESIASSAALLLITAVFTYKTAVFPWQLYAPDVYQGQTLISLIFTSVIPKMGAFLGLSAFFSFLPQIGEFSSVLMVLIVLSWFYSNISALTEASVPRIIAFSSVSHASFMVACLLIPSSENIMLIYAFSYGISTVILLGVLAAFDKGPDFSLSRLKEAVLANPLSGFAFAISVFSLAGVPPLPVFFAKFYLLKELVKNGYTGLAVLGVLFSAVAAGYYLKMTKYAFLGDAAEVKEKAEAGFPVFTVSLNILVLVFFAVFASYLFKLLPAN